MKALILAFTLVTIQFVISPAQARRYDFSYNYP